EQDDVLLVHEGTQHDPLDREGQPYHHRSRQAEREKHGRAALEQADEREGRKQHHHPLGEVEHARGLEDQHEAERDQRVHEARAHSPRITPPPRTAGAPAMSLNGATSAAYSTSTIS